MNARTLLMTVVSALTLATAALAQPKPAAVVVTGSDVTQGNQAIHDLANTGTGAEVEKALKANPALRDARNVRGATPLHFAAINPDGSALKVLIAAGADVNAKDEDGTTPLHMSALARQTQAALLLLEAGADVNATRNDGRTPRALAEKSRADETGGVLALWILKGCKAGSDCGLSPTTRNVKKLVK